jgi:hypothetical protein
MSEPSTLRQALERLAEVEGENQLLRAERDAADEAVSREMARADRAERQEDANRRTLTAQRDAQARLLYEATARAERAEALLDLAENWIRDSDWDDYCTSKEKVQAAGRTTEASDDR